MKTKFFWLSVIAVLLSFFGGFFVANTLNRTELNTLRAEFESLKTGGSAANQTGPGEMTLSPEEIRKSIAQADSDPGNMGFQKTLGSALYRYAAMKQDPLLMLEAARLLGRVYQKEPKDPEVLVTLGNIYFDIGYFNKENDSLIKSREYYEAFLRDNPTNPDVRTDYGLSFFLTDPPETDRAIAEYNRSLQNNPSHEKTLQVLAQALLSQNKTAEAQNYLSRLEKVNPNNPYLADLKKQVTPEPVQNQ